MKITEHPDGTKTREGTPEELATYYGYGTASQPSAPLGFPIPLPVIVLPTTVPSLAPMQPWIIRDPLPWESPSRTEPLL